MARVLGFESSWPYIPEPDLLLILFNGTGAAELTGQKSELGWHLSRAVS